ncbi:hypothetical protein OS493_021162 [Desmophyllum pertusum]|uniref:Uncharacterized protein n=1 Tax=Desmophyllum pertusum TaxID=174260 RepID=A0A9W9ZPJ2_9CNID|nr:hypothetical protein OS493_021162 [Desmophyllum pertusum]
MSVCAKHRHTCGKFWRPRTPCQYPAHQGRPGRSQKSRYSVNMEMAKSIIQIMYGVLVQVGSGAYKYAYRFERKTGQGDGSDSMYCPGAVHNAGDKQDSKLHCNLHNFEFNQEGLRAWKAFNVGPGKFIPWNDIVICPQRKTDLMEEIQIFPTIARQFASKERNKGQALRMS